MSSKPTLSLSTPVTANFPHIPPPPSELRSAVSLPSAVETPLSAISRTSAFRDPLPSSGLPSAGLPSAGPFSATLKFEYDMQKTPITPPVAYLDFLKSMSLVSPCLTSPPHTGKAALNRTSTASSTVSSASASSKDSTPSSVTSDAASLDDGEKEKIELIESGPSTARSDVNSECGDDEKTKEREKSPRPSPISIKSPPTPVNSYYPLSAPPAGPSVFPSMKLPTSPAVSASGLYSPRSPLSAASVHSPFDWDAALKAKRFSDIPGAKRPAAPETPTVAVPAPTHAKRESRSSIRHIREVVTRTVTYTPRMAPAPKGKRRKLDSQTTPKS
ncbi:hypothetical protein B0T24DRAFT_371599 [Lasiosphaeria ovina]|uniref:Uncharacterized protein n=1 Tax=Lasiosphaeria ovina TaxID=92902 RepID=A0AAE0JZI3_9PEZI|nr:hypothetical protein B0T24DRAFT_371599 [Lasiosphaeria ovina]